MPIQEQNIVFVESQVMDDVPEGGGAATGRVIVDGKMNNVFEDISDLDRAYGRFNLRKIFLAVRTLSTDLYGGAKSVITALPQDDALGYTLFSSADPFDTRAQAANKVEAYLYKGPTWGGYLLENHIAGMRAISLIQRVGAPVPNVGKTLVLVLNEGLVSEVEQYVRVTGVDVAERTFTDGQTTAGDDITFTRWVVTLSLSDALRSNFAGHEARRLDSQYTYTGKTRVRDTTVADATRYYGAQPLADAVGVGDITLRAQSIYTKLVPSAQTETPLINQIISPEVVATYSAGARTVDVAQQAHTRALGVTAETRRLNWVETVAPIPAPGALTVSFRAQGNWYQLADNGAGNLVASDPSIGAGTVSYSTGVIAVTLGALPDVGSQVIIVWASPVHYDQRTGSAADAAGTLDFEYTLAHAPVVPGSFSVSYPVSGVSRTATDTAATGAIGGTGVTGRIDYATGRVSLRFAAPPDRTASLSNGYTWRDGLDLFSGTSATITDNALTVPGTAPFRSAGTMRLLVSMLYGNVEVDAYLADGGVLRILPGRAELSGYRFAWADQIVGSLNLASGLLQLTGALDGAGVATIGVTISGWSAVMTEFESASIRAGVVGVSDIAVERDTAAYDPQSVAAELFAINGPGLALNLTATVSDTLVPNSLRFSAAGKTYDDRDGVLYADINPATGSGIVAGSVDYGTGIARITFWADGAGAGVSVASCLTRYGQWTAVDAAFRAVLSPIKPEALSVTATSRDGTVISGTADADGEISGALVRGSINYEMGTAALEFGVLVGGVWQSREVLPETIRYNAVAYSYLPLDADILGIDPVRLPSDGRVPIYRAGDVVMVMHTAETAPQSVINGGTINLGRTRIGWIRVIDATGKSAVGGYNLDRAMGIVTFSDVSEMTMPVRVRHTVGDLRQITDAQITGQLTLARPLTHSYPAGESIVASCLIHGDRRARVSAVWDQATWGGTWSDSLIGSEATATLDTIAHPIQVTNEGAETERWLLRWTSTTNVELIGQRRGLVFSGPFTADIAPINPRTRNPDGTGGAPYLRIPLAANGGGWSTGNVVRINTVGALADIWIARSIQQSDEPLGDGEDGVELYALGNIDRP